MKTMEPLTHTELLAVLRVAREASARDHALFLLCYSHGLRSSEVAQLKLANLNVRDWTLRIERKKHSKMTVQAVLPNSDKSLDERRALKMWLVDRPTVGPYLFSKPNGGCLSRIQVYRLFRQYAEAVGLPESKRGAHALKHSLCQHMVESHQDVARVQAAVGHASLGSTLHYFTVSPAQADEARAAALMQI